jgi:DNA-binding LytR/AlgR family response regulator
MSKIKCVIVEDNPTDMELLMHFVKAEPSLDLRHTFNNALEALATIKELQPPLLFMDIDMPVMNGIDLFKNLGYHPICIFVTAHSEYALESYEAQAFDFILKPVSDKRFAQAMRRLTEFIKLKERADLYDTAFETESILIKEGSTNYKVLLSDILYIEALKDYSKVVTTGKKYITLSKLKHFIDKLPIQDFVRVHRSYAVAKNKINVFGKEEMKINNEVIPIGVTYRQELKQMLEN